MKTIAIESLQNVPEYTGFTNHETITIREGQEWDGHTYGFCVGMIKDDGTVNSCFKEDRKNGNTQLFDRLKAEMELYEKHCHLRKRDSLELYDATITFYDDIGESCEVELYSIRELLSMITSIRVVKCEKKIISDTNEPGSLGKAL